MIISISDPEIVSSGRRTQAVRFTVTFGRNAEEPDYTSRGWLYRWDKDTDAWTVRPSMSRTFSSSRPKYFNFVSEKLQSELTKAVEKHFRHFVTEVRRHSEQIRQAALAAHSKQEKRAAAKHYVLDAL